MNALLNAMVVLLSGLAAQDFQVELKGPAKISAGTPVQIAIPAGINVKSKTCLLSGVGTTNLLGQVVEKFSADLTSKENQQYLVVVLPALSIPDNGATLAGTWLASDAKNSSPSFSFEDKNSELSQVTLEGKPVLQFVHPVLKEGKEREASYKPFHHLFDNSGSLVTKGAGGQFTHHRGIFLGFSKVTYGNNVKVDIWHCKDDTHQAFQKVLLRESGPVLASEKDQIAWNGKNKETFAVEERQLIVYKVPGGQLVEFQSVVRTTGGPVLLDGDPQHAGFHFRASNDVAEKTFKQTIYLRPDGEDQPGASRNWPDLKTHINLPWNAMSFVLNDKRYTALYLDNSTNPKEARFSERPYGRFGSYFVTEITKENPLKLKYQIWLQDGKIDIESAKLKSQSFNNPMQAIMVAK
jgi:hypothetical protein